MYLRKSKIGTFKTVNAFLIAILGVTSFCNLLVAVLLFFSEQYAGDKYATFWGVFILILMFAKTGLLVWRAILIHRITKCRIYNSIFEEDHDGIIEYSSIAAMIGRPEANVIKDLMWLVKEKFIVNVTLGRTAVRVDVRAGENEFVTVACPTCGAHITIRKNGGGRCEHCGTFMRLKENQNV